MAENQIEEELHTGEHGVHPHGGMWAAMHGNHGSMGHRCCAPTGSLRSMPGLHAGVNPQTTSGLAWQPQVVTHLPHTLHNLAPTRHHAAAAR